MVLFRLIPQKKMMGASINNAVEEIIHEEIDTNEINDDDFDLANNITEKIANGSISPHDQHHYEVGLVTIQKRGIKVVVGSVVSIVVSVMLFLGAKQGKSLFFIPWLTEQIVALSAGIIHGLIMAMGGFLMDIKVLEIILVMVIFVISSFMI